MKFSVIIPLYNKEKTIRRAIYSVLDQQGINENDVEIFVVNDGSTDASVDQVIKVACEQSHRKLTLVNQINGGVSVARNRGASLSNHPVLCFLDADDTYKRTFLNELTALAENHPKSAVYATAYNFVNTNNGTVKKARLRGLIKKSRHQELANFFSIASLGDLPFCTSSFAIKRSVFNMIGGFPEGENMGEDQDLFVKVAVSHKITFSQKPCVNYFTGVEGSLMGTQSVIEEMPFSKRLQKRIDKGDLPEHLRHSSSKYIAGHLTDLIRRNLANGNIRATKTLLSDKRAKARYVKWLYWKTRFLLARIQLRK